MTETERIVLGKDILDERIILISGPSRTGKTLLSKVLSTYDNVEWIEEPYSLRLLIEMCANGKIDRDSFGKMFAASVNEVFNDQILLRSANFRPGDLSNIWDQKSVQHITHRLNSLQSREDVSMYMEKVRPYFIIDIPDVLPYTELLREKCSNLIVICVVRDPYDAAVDYLNKGWFESAGEQSAYNSLYREYGTKRIPTWVRRGEEEEYLKASPYERGLMYWVDILAGDNEAKQDSLIDTYVRYEDMTENIDDVLGSLSRFIDITGHETPMTEAAKSRIHKSEHTFMKRDITHVNIGLLNMIMEKYGYGS